VRLCQEQATTRTFDPKRGEQKKKAHGKRNLKFRKERNTRNAPVSPKKDTRLIGTHMTQTEKHICTIYYIQYKVKYLTLAHFCFNFLFGISFCGPFCSFKKKPENSGVSFQQHSNEIDIHICA